jgi:hypothetical protein
MWLGLGVLILIIPYVVPAVEHLIQFGLQQIDGVLGGR